MKNKKTVLVVENDKKLRDALVILLQEMWLTVHEAYDSVDALETIRTIPIDLVIVDLRLPDRGSIAFITHILEYNDRAEIIAISDIVSTTAYDRMRKLGVFRLFAVPFKIEEIKDAVVRGLSSNRAERLLAEPSQEMAYTQDFVGILVFHSNLSLFQKILEIGLSAGWSVDYAPDMDTFKKNLAVSSYDILVIADSVLNDFEKAGDDTTFCFECKPIVFVVSDTPKKLLKSSALSSFQIEHLPATFSKNVFITALQSLLPAYLMAKETSSIAVMAKKKDTDTKQPIFSLFRSWKKSLFSLDAVFFMVIIILAGVAGYVISTMTEKKAEVRQLEQQMEMMQQMQQYERMQGLYNNHGH